MCGIAGCLHQNRRVVERMLKGLRHRGPDDTGILEAPDFTLGHTRLSIIDVATGHQPMTNEDGSLKLVFNGELYNYESLREALIEKGHRFTTNSDSEVVLHLYEEKGPALLDDVYGMFAFVLVTPEGALLARDPLGIKPLYYGFDEAGELHFASELKVLVPYVTEPREFPAGHYCWIARGDWGRDGSEPGGARESRDGRAPGVGRNQGDGRNPEDRRRSRGEPGFRRYYRLPETTEDLHDLKRIEREVEERLLSAVKSRLVADVPVGTFLSGGLDSSLIAAMAARELGTPIHSFAVGCAGSEDLDRARLVAEHIGSEHHERVFGAEEILEHLPQVIRSLESFDPALVRSAIPTYLVSGLARRHVKVVLSGEGADELFAGYQYLKHPAIREELQEELRSITLALHNTNLQRVDRMSMAHGLEARVPFLSMHLLDVAWRIPARFKLGRPGDVEKWILRRIASRYLPEVIAWRDKAKFAIGTGVGPILEEHANRVISDKEFERGRKPLPGLTLKSKEELLYFWLFQETFGEKTRDVVPLVGRSRSLNPGQVYAGKGA